MKTLLFSAIATLYVIFLLAFNVPAQNNVQDLTWSELKTVQKQQRDELKQTHADELRQLIDIQKSTLADVAGNSGPTRELAILHSQERNAAMLHYSDERKRLAELQTQERVAFKQRSP